MSGKLKEVRERMKSVQSTQQITKAMKMVSAAKLRRSQDNIVKLRPYAEELRSVLNEVLSSLGGEVDLPLLKPHSSTKNVLMICITSDRGLCGAFNNNIVKLADEHVKANYADANVQIWGIGKKGSESLGRKGYKTHPDFLNVAHPTVNVEGVKNCVRQATELFLKGEVDVIEVVYNEFRNVAMQVPKVERMLPFDLSDSKSAHNNAPSTATETQQQNSLYIFEQEPIALLEYVIPMTLNTQLLKAVFDSIASEHGARMTSMDKATENANEIFKQLKVSYNRARQAAITTEITEIIAGSASI